MVSRSKPICRMLLCRAFGAERVGRVVLRTQTIRMDFVRMNLFNSNVIGRILEDELTVIANQMIICYTAAQMNQRMGFRCRIKAVHVFEQCSSVLSLAFHRLGAIRGHLPSPGCIAAPPPMHGPDLSKCRRFPKAKAHGIYIYLRGERNLPNMNTYRFIGVKARGMNTCKKTRGRGREFSKP